MPGRAALSYVYRQYALSAAATHAVDLQTLIHIQFSGDLKSFIHVWDACLLAMSPVLGPDFIYSLQLSLLILTSIIHRTVES